MQRALMGLTAAALLLPLTVGCKTDDAADEVVSAGETVVDAGADVAEEAGDAITEGVPSLVNVDLSNVLNDLAVRLNLDKANIPINAQIPITLAANVCGVSINILSVSTGGQANCTAETSSPELAQVVQQQIAAGGSVGGGDQGGSTAGTSGTTTGTTGTTTTNTMAEEPATTNEMLEANQQKPEDEPQ